MEDSLHNNLYEVLNIGVSFFSDRTTSDMLLKNMFVDASELPSDVHEVFKRAAYTDLHVEMDIPGYGGGSSSMYLV